MYVYDKTVVAWIYTVNSPLYKKRKRFCVFFFFKTRTQSRESGEKKRGAQEAKLAAGYLLLFDWSESLETAWAAQKKKSPGRRCAAHTHTPLFFFSFLSLEKGSKKEKEKRRERERTAVYNSSNWSSARKGKSAEFAQYATWICNIKRNRQLAS